MWVWLSFIWLYYCNFTILVGAIFLLPFSLLSLSWYRLACLQRHEYGWSRRLAVNVAACRVIYSLGIVVHLWSCKAGCNKVLELRRSLINRRWSKPHLFILNVFDRYFSRLQCFNVKVSLLLLKFMWLCWLLDQGDNQLIAIVYMIRDLRPVDQALLLCFATVVPTWPTHKLKNIVQRIFKRFSIFWV